MEIENTAFPGDRLSRRAMAASIASPSMIVICADCAGALVGYGLIHLRRGSLRARLASLAARPGGPKGVGRALMEALKAGARARGCASMHLEVRADNDRAIALYERLGFRKIGETPDYYEDGAAAYRFEIIL
jgi:ribosomal protein S18 acetylase RimI-like enzyme